MWKLRERLKKQEEEKQNRPIDPLLPFGLRRGMLGQMFKGKIGDIRTFAGMFHCDSRNLPFFVEVNHCVFVQIPCIGQFRFPEFDIKSVRIFEVFDFHGSNLR
jgi:hypothetical protein